MRNDSRSFSHFSLSPPLTILLSQCNLTCQITGANVVQNASKSPGKRNPCTHSHTPSFIYGQNYKSNYRTTHKSTDQPSTKKSRCYRNNVKDMSEIEVFFGDISEYCNRTGYAVNTNKDDNEPNDGEFPHVK